MRKEFTTTSKVPHLIIEKSNGPLTIRVSPEKRLLLKGNDFNIDEKGENSDTYLIQNNADLSIWVSESAVLTIEEAHGPVVIKGVQGELNVKSYHGNLTLKNAGETTITSGHGSLLVRDNNGSLTIESLYGDFSLRNGQNLTVNSLHGDLMAKNLNGSVNLKQVTGDISLRTISEDVTIEYGGRDVNLRNVGGILTANQVDGDIRLYDQLISGSHVIKAKGDVVIRWPLTNLNLDATAYGEIICQLPLEDQISNKEKKERPQTLIGRMGDGKTNLTIESQGDIILKRLTSGESHENINVDIDLSDFSEFGAQMAAFGEEMASGFDEQFTAHMESLSKQFERKFDHQYAEQVARKAEEAAEKLSRKIEDAMHKVQQRIANAEYAAATHPTPPTPPTHPGHPTPPTPPSATQEDTSAAQLKVLEMLEKGTITVEEANTLLKALE